MRHTRHYSRDWRIAALLTISLLAAACGADRSNSTDSSAGTDAPATESSDSSADDSATGDTATDDTAEDDSSGTEANESTESETDEPAAEAAMFGDAPWPCGPGDAAGATDQGVTDDTILLGAGDDRGFDGSGLNEAMGQAVEAAVAECNALGGINGRQIELTNYDAKLFEISVAMTDACEREFMIVGQGFAVDGFGEEIRVQCDLAHIPAWTVSATAAHGPGMVQPIPNPADQIPLSLAAWFSDTYPDETQATGTLYTNFAATVESNAKIEAGYPEVGFNFIAGLEYNVAGEEDWTPFVLQLKEAGAKTVFYSGSCLPAYQAIRAAAVVNEFDALWLADTPLYETGCAAANTDGAMDSTFVRSAFLPFEERDVAPGVDSYLTMMEGTGADTTALALQSVSAFLLWATAASACGSELTRDCVLANAASVEGWTGHGSHAPTNPGDNTSPQCGMVLEIVGTSYVRAHPAERGTFDCSEDFVARDLQLEAVEDALLDADRVSQRFVSN